MRKWIRRSRRFGSGLRLLRPWKGGHSGWGFRVIKLIGTPEGGGEPVRAESVLCHIGAEETLESFTENLRGAEAARQNICGQYPDDYPDPKLSGKTYDYTVEVLGSRKRSCRS